MPKEYFKKKGQSNSFKMTNPFKHFVDDNKEHQDTYGDHSDDLQTDAEHDAAKGGGGEGTRTHWPDGTKRTEREMFEYDETQAEETKEAAAPTKILDPTADPSIMSQQGTVGTLGGGMNDPSIAMYKKKKY